MIFLIRYIKKYIFTELLYSVIYFTTCKIYERNMYNVYCVGIIRITINKYDLLMTNFTGYILILSYI